MHLRGMYLIRCVLPYVNLTEIWGASVDGRAYCKYYPCADAHVDCIEEHTRVALGLYNCKTECFVYVCRRRQKTMFQVFYKYYFHLSHVYQDGKGS